MRFTHRRTSAPQPSSSQSSARGGFDSGRCSQNMMLAAWGEGVASCPNGVRDPDAAAAICGGEVRAILSFGYPARPRDVAGRSAEEWSARANRKPLDELVREVD